MSRGHDGRRALRPSSDVCGNHLRIVQLALDEGCTGSRGWWRVLSLAGFRQGATPGVFALVHRRYGWDQGLVLPLRIVVNLLLGGCNRGTRGRGWGAWGISRDVRGGIIGHSSASHLAFPVPSSIVCAGCHDDQQEGEASSGDGEPLCEGFLGAFSSAGQSVAIGRGLRNFLCL